MASFSAAACLQMQIQVGDVEANMAHFEGLLAQLAPRPDTLIVLPEFWATGFDYAGMADLARHTTHILAVLQQKAREHSVWFAGSLPEKRDQGLPSNTLFLVSPAGVAGQYRKHHLFGFWLENMHLQPGRKLPALDTPFGPLGALICYDLRFPEMVRRQAFAGCRTIVVAAQWPLSRVDHWEILLRARAVENQVCIVACNGCGVSGFGELAGHSMIIAPDGNVLARAGLEPSGIGVELTEEKLQLHAVRERFCTAGERLWAGFDREKIVSMDDLMKRTAILRDQNSQIVFTNGCFDLLHAGHVSYLEQARRCGDCLVVGVNSNRSVRALKGPSRPVNDEQDRARVLAGLGCVDYVVIFDEDTPRQMIASLLPHVLVKGADWPEEQIAGAAEVKAAGGRVERIVFRHQRSTSSVINKIQQQQQ